MLLGMALFFGLAFERFFFGGGRGMARPVAALVALAAGSVGTAFLIGR